MSKWSKSQDAQLIRLVAQQRVLYDPAAPDHRNLLAKHHAWSDISVALDMPIPAIKKRWKHFRDHYRKKERQSQANIKNNWEYMPMLGFLSSVNTDNQESEAQTSNVEDVTDAEDVNDSRESHSNQGTENPLISNKIEDNNLSERVTEETKEISIESRSPLKKIEPEFYKTIEALNFDRERKKNQAVEIYRRRRSIINRKVNDLLGDLDNNAKNNENNQNVGSYLKSDGKRESIEVEKNSKRQKTTRESNSEEEMTDSGIIREEISETLSGMRSKFQSMILDIERCVEKTGSYANAKKRMHVSPVHRYFEVVGDIVAMLPPHLVAKTRLKTCETINQIEELYLQNFKPKNDIKIDKLQNSKAENR